MFFCSMGPVNIKIGPRRATAMRVRGAPPLYHRSRPYDGSPVRSAVVGAEIHVVRGKESAEAAFRAQVLRRTVGGKARGHGRQPEIIGEREDAPAVVDPEAG